MIRPSPAFGAVLTILLLSWPASAADRVSGNITRTFVIVEDTDLIGDVTCDVSIARAAASTICSRQWHG
jgi:hypothetical protein